MDPGFGIEPPPFGNGMEVLSTSRQLRCYNRKTKRCGTPSSRLARRQVVFMRRLNLTLCRTGLPTQSHPVSARLAHRSEPFAATGRERSSLLALTRLALI